MDDPDEEKQFTLPSNSSMRFYPKNTPSNYTTKLSSTHNFEGEWEAALMEIQYPHNWMNLKDDVYVTILIRPMLEKKSIGMDKMTESCRFWTETYKGKVDKAAYAAAIEIAEKSDFKALATIIRISAGYYDSPESFVARTNEALNVLFETPGLGLIEELKTLSAALEYDKFSKLVRFRNSRISYLAFLTTNPYFIRFLGLENPSEDKISYTVPLRKEARARVDKITALYIYSDITKYQIVGDTLAPLMGVCPVSGSDGDQQHYVFKPPFYIPINTQSITSLNLRINDQYGEEIPFDPSGQVICRIILRRRRRPW